MTTQTTTDFSDHRSSAAKMVSVLQVLLEEFHTFDAMERIQQLNIIVAAYIALYKFSDSDGGASLLLFESC